MDHKVHFDEIPWVETSKYSRAKAFIHGNQQIRMVEFREGFTEPDWCRKGHAGIVLEGAFSSDFNGKIEYFKKGDIVMIDR